jgi:hypothetical protein
MMLFKSHQKPHIEILNQNLDNKMYINAGAIYLEIFCKDLVYIKIDTFRLRLVSDEQLIKITFPVLPSKNHLIIKGYGVLARKQIKLSLYQDNPKFDIKRPTLIHAKGITPNSMTIKPNIPMKQPSFQIKQNAPFGLTPKISLEDLYIELNNNTTEQHEK